MSDLARGLACPRAVITRKLHGEPGSLALERLLQLRRGHWLEYGIEEALTAAGQKFISQLEINIEHQGMPIKAHLDLVLFDEDGKSVTVEVQMRSYKVAIRGGRLWGLIQTVDLFAPEMFSFEQRLHGCPSAAHFALVCAFIIVEADPVVKISLQLV